MGDLDCGSFDTSKFILYISNDEVNIGNRYDNIDSVSFDSVPKGETGLGYVIFNITSRENSSQKNIGKFPFLGKSVSFSVCAEDGYVVFGDVVYFMDESKVLIDSSKPFIQVLVSFQFVAD